MQQAKTIWSALNRKQALLNNLGLGQERPVDKEVIICILSNAGIILEDIIRHPYFMGYGRSTIKRAVSRLVTQGRVEMVRDPRDLRRSMITFVGVGN